jgi:eukaryotic-like serine/threonine-protein kinase
MDTKRLCWKCRAPLPTDAPRGLCPACLLGLAVSGDDDDAPPAAAEIENQKSPTANPRVRYFGDYELQDEIARGGMGVVYRARQSSLNRPVALKMILAANFASEADVARFRREAESAANLDHPNIIPIYEVGEHDGRHYFSMRLIEGTSLAERMRNEDHSQTPLTRPSGTLSPRPMRGEGWGEGSSLKAAVHLITKVARAVHYAHQHGILHRDLKPANILLDASGEPFVTDFGLARSVEGDSALTLSGAVMGTPAYMAPEQATASKTITTSADIYSLGAILYEALTGQPPFKGGTVIETIQHVLDDEPRPPRELSSSVDKDLETIALKCLEKDPARRYSSAEALAADLDHWLNHEPIAARPIGGVERAVKWARRKPALAALILVTLLAVSAYIGLALFNKARFLRERDLAIEARMRAELAEKETEQKLWQSYLAQARANRWSGRAGRRFESLGVLARAAEIKPSLELRNEAIASLALADLRLASQWQGRPPGTSLVGVDDKFELYARGDEQGSVSVRRLADDSELAALPGFGVRAAWIMQFSPDARLLAVAYGDTRRCRVWDWKEKRIVADFDDVFQFAFDFSPDGLRLALGGQDGAIRLFDLEAGQTTLRFNGGAQPHTLRFSPDGSQIAVSLNGRPLVEIHDVVRGQLLHTLTNAAAVRQIGWHPDGKSLAAPCANGQTVIWELGARPRQRVVLAGHRNVAAQACFNRRGDLLATSGWDGTLRLWNAVTGEALVNHKDSSMALHFSPDETRLGPMYDGAQLRVLEVAAGRECRALPGHPGRVVWTADFTKDGRWLATGGSEGVRLWDLQTDRQAAFLNTAETRAALFHPGGQGLFTSAANGLEQWPLDIVTNETGVASVRFGQPTRLPATYKLERACLSPDGKVAFAAHGTGIRVVTLDGSAATYVLKGHPGAAFISLSPDGKWLASGTWKGQGVEVWDWAATNVVAKLDVRDSADVAFSPDGRWLVTGNSEEYVFWKAGDWTRSHAVARERSGDFFGRMCFSPDGRMLALAHTRDLVKLVDTATGNELATLEAGPQTPLAFTPDGAQLVVAGERGALQIWDLARIRRQLAAMKMDWQ